MQSFQVYHFNFEWGHQIDFLFFLLWYRRWLFLLVTNHRFDSCLEEIWRLGVLGLDPLGFPCLISCLYRSSWRGWRIVYFRYVARYSSLECLKLLFWFLVVVILFSLFYMLVHLDFDQVIQRGIFYRINTLIWTTWGWKPIFICKRNVNCFWRTIAWSNSWFHSQLTGRTTNWCGICNSILQTTSAWFITLMRRFRLSL